MALVYGYLKNSAGDVALAGNVIRFHSWSGASCNSTVVASCTTNAQGQYSVNLNMGKYAITVIPAGGSNCCMPAGQTSLNVGTITLFRNLVANCAVCAKADEERPAVYLLYDAQKMSQNPAKYRGIVSSLDKTKYHWTFVDDYGYCDDGMTCQREAVGLIITDLGSNGSPPQLGSVLVRATDEGGCCCQSSEE